MKLVIQDLPQSYTFSYFYKLLRALFSPKYLPNFFFSNLYIPLWFEKMFKIMVFRLLENPFDDQKTQPRHFYSCFPQWKFSPYIVIITP